MPQKQQILLKDFDRLSKDYKEHQNELHQKLVSIMEERVIAHSAELLVRLS